MKPDKRELNPQDKARVNLLLERIAIRKQELAREQEELEFICGRYLDDGEKGTYRGGFIEVQNGKEGE